MTDPSKKDETPEPERKKPGPKPKPTRAEDIIAAAANLSEEERARLEGVLGRKLPVGVDDLDAPSKWGYLCTHCGRDAFRFPGTKWRHPDGREVDYPPAGVPLDNVPWIKLKGDPRSKQCQHCGAPFVMGRNQTILPPFEMNAEGTGYKSSGQRCGIIDVERHEAMRAASYSVSGMRETRAKIASMNSSFADADQNYSLRDSPNEMAEAIARGHQLGSAARQVLEGVVAATSLDEAGFHKRQ